MTTTRISLKAFVSAMVHPHNEFYKINKEVWSVDDRSWMAQGKDVELATSHRMNFELIQSELRSEYQK